MIIEIDVPNTTQAISVSAVYRIGETTTVSLTSRCFMIVDGQAEDETGSNKVLQGG
jgi:hypothetical protein